MTRDASLAGAIHDLQARLGSIRIAVTAVAGLDLDEETRNEMLTSASDESVRASAELAGVSALTTCLLDDSASEPCDVVAALQAATDTARLGGLDIHVDAQANPTTTASKERLAVVLPALLRLVGGAGKEVRVTVTADGVAMAGDDSEPVPAIAGYLVAELGASIGFTFGTIA
jgi:hypothetical protein